MRRGDAFHHLVYPFNCGIRAFHGDQLAVDAKNDGRRRFYMNIGGLAFDGNFQNAMK